MQTDMNLSQIVHEYVRPGRQAELEWFRQQQTLESAIQYAALANIKGKRHRHQCRLKKVALEKALQILLSKFKAIAQAKDFDDLFQQVKKLCEEIRGIGELYVYDTSLRIGAKLNLMPTKVYLHNGTRVGARALGLDCKAKTLEKKQMPSELRHLEAYEIEDVFCIFKDNFSKYMKVNLNRRGC